MRSPIYNIYHDLYSCITNTIMHEFLRSRNYNAYMY
eukprot:UN27869